MGKRSDFERVERDFYATPFEAVGPVIPYIVGRESRARPLVRFAEPCAGDGRLIRHAETYGMRCVWAGDIEPQAAGIEKCDALTITGFEGADMFFTNPPWDREILHPLIERLSNILPTWLLLDADWKETKQATAFADRCRDIVPIGRVRWMEGTDNDGKDNASWYLFDKPLAGNRTIFHWRAA